MTGLSLSIRFELEVLD